MSTWMRMLSTAVLRLVLAPAPESSHAGGPEELECERRAAHRPRARLQLQPVWSRAIGTRKEPELDRFATSSRRTLRAGATSTASRLMAPRRFDLASSSGEIARYRSSKAPTDAWEDLRLLADALFLRRFDSEYLEEMERGDRRRGTSSARDTP